VGKLKTITELIKLLLSDGSVAPTLSEKLEIGSRI